MNADQPDVERTWVVLHKPGGERVELWAALRLRTAVIESTHRAQVGDVLEHHPDGADVRFLRITGVRNFDSGPDLSYSEVMLVTTDGPPDPRVPADRSRPQAPRLFIGSSSEGLPTAEYMQVGLEHSCECTIWNQGVFAPSEVPLESLARAVDRYDYAVLVLTPDDVTTKRGVSGNAPRDNIMFELGLFIGALGRDHTFIVCQRDHRLVLPSDLAGLTPITFELRENMSAALGPVCRKLKTAMGLP